MGAGAYWFEVVEGSDSPLRLLQGENTTVQIEYVFNELFGGTPIDEFLTLELVGLPSGMSAVFKIGGQVITGFEADTYDKDIELVITNTSSSALGVFTLIIRATFQGTQMLYESWVFESAIGSNFMQLLTGHNGDVCRNGGSSWGGVDTTVTFQYKDEGSEADAGKDMYLKIIGLPTDITAQFQDSGGSSITYFSIPDPVSADIALKCKFTANTDMIAPATYPLTVEVHEGSIGGDIQQHLSTMGFTIHTEGQVGLGSSGSHVAFGTEWHGTVFSSDNSSAMYPIHYKYFSGAVPGALTITVASLPSGVTVQLYDASQTGSQITTFGGGTEVDTMWIKFIVASGATKVNADIFSVDFRNVSSGFSEVLGGVIFIEDNYQIGVSITPTSVQPITGGQTGAYVITATRLTDNCSGRVDIVPSHPSDDVSAHSFSWEPIGGASLKIDQASSVKTSEFRITPHLESDNENNLTRFKVTVNSNTAGDIKEIIAV